MGLGEALAELLARDGHDVVLVARSEARLEAVAERLRRHGAAAHVVPADLSRPAAPREVFDAVRARGLEVEILVNNAGFGSNGAFLDQPLEGEGDMVEVNCNALLKLSHLFGAGMRARKRGRILNIASTAAFQAGPYMATYFATKAFVLSFSEALADELRPSGVTVTCYCPGATHTEFAARAGNDKAALFKRGAVATAKDVAGDAYEAMLQGDVVAVHGLFNWLRAQSVRLAPRAVARAVAASLNLPPE